MQGDAQALINLATISGGQGVNAGIPGAGIPSTSTSGLTAAFPSLGPTLLGGWGSTAAELDAVSKYQQVKAYLATAPMSPSVSLATLGSSPTLLIVVGLLVVGGLFLVSRK